MATRSALSDAQRAMAAALLWHFEDDDVRQENMKLRTELIAMQQQAVPLETYEQTSREIVELRKENQALLQQVAQAYQEQQKAFAEANTWRDYMVKLNGFITSLVGQDQPPANEKMDQTILRRIRLCGMALKEVTTSYKALTAEHMALKARLAELGQSLHASHSPNETTPQGSSRLPPDSSGQDFQPMKVEGYEDTVGDMPLTVDPRATMLSAPPTSSATISLPLASAPSQHQPSLQDVQQVQPPPRSDSLSPTPPPRARCQCPAFVVISPTERTALIQTEEPKRAGDWLQAAFVAADPGGGTVISQAEMYKAYKSLGASDPLSPATFFSLIKAVFPSSKCVKTEATPGSNSKEAYVIRGVTRRPAPCTCGLRPLQKNSSHQCVSWD